MSRQYFLICILFILTGFRFITGCSRDPGGNILSSDVSIPANAYAAVDTSTIPIGIDELLPGDIIVRANNNWLPGSCFVPGGYTFGHAAVVISGANSRDPDSLLMKALIWESNSRDVSPENQIRLVNGYLIHPDPNLSNLSFGPAYAGIRYRLRVTMTPAELNELITFLKAQDQNISSWRALKRDGSLDETSTCWYCTLIIREAFLRIKGIDLDANQGLVVYPNDIISSPWFDGKNGKAGRIRF